MIMNLRDLAARSRATPAFRVALDDFLSDAHPSERIVFDGRSPAVKVERALTKLLVEHPELPIDRVVIDAASGCEFYRGEMRVSADGETLRIRFHWDCKWKAAEQGWLDYFGFPDQIRAAREFGFDCFRAWETAAPGQDATLPALAGD
jgi:hypothetical protein